jgi:hypothetical protein
VTLKGGDQRRSRRHLEVRCLEVSPLNPVFHRSPSSNDSADERRIALRSSGFRPLDSLGWAGARSRYDNSRW